MNRHLADISRPRPAFAVESKIVLPLWQRILFDLANGILSLLGKPPLAIIQ